MIRTITNHWNGNVIWTGEAKTVKDALHAAYAAGAVLRGADLTDADLRDADLRGADLTDAVLTGAVLTGADLTGADLTGAVLTDADLTGAVLTGADLTDAARLPTGESWTDYLTIVLPALLTAGGKTLESFATSWTCNDWTNCPMAHAFDVHEISGVPMLLRPRAKQFIQFFDAHLIPWPLPTAEQLKPTT